jgi:hypothetical protein
MTASAHTRLLDLLSPDKSGEWYHYETKIKGLGLSEADYASACEALETGDFVLNRLVSDALWNEDITMMKVLIRTYGFIEKIITHEINRDQYPSKKVAECYKSNVLGKSAKNATETDIERIASHFKADFLTSMLYLSATPKILTRMDIVEFVKFPLVHNEEAVEAALPVILGIWFMSSTGELSSRPDFEDLFDMVDLFGERPDNADLIIDLTRGRMGYDGAVIREMLNSDSKALASGTL